MEKLSDEKIIQMQPLVLAMIGDGVQTLFVREYVAKTYGFKINKMTKVVSTAVRASSQFKTFKLIEEELNETEKSLCLRARNAHIHTKAKNFSYTEYIYATALEALFGYLHLSGQSDRLEHFLNISLKQLEID